MPDTASPTPAANPEQLARQLADAIHGPYDDTATVGAAALAAEAIRYLNYATPRGGITEPATIYTVTAELSAALYRLPQLMSQLADWLTAETSADRIADDQHRPAWQLTDTTRDILDQAAMHAADLATALADTAYGNLTSSAIRQKVHPITTAPLGRKDQLFSGVSRSVAAAASADTIRSVPPRPYLVS